MLIPVPLLFDINTSKLGLSNKEIIEVLRSFCKEVNFGVDDSFVYLESKDRLLAMCELVLACTLSDEYNKLDDRDAYPYSFFRQNKVDDDLSDSDMLSFISRCLDRVYKGLFKSLDLDTINNSIDIYVHDAKNKQFKFKFINEFTLKCTSSILEYYSKTIKGFNSELIESGEDKNLYKFRFDPFVIPVRCEELRYSILFDLASCSYSGKYNEAIEGILKIYKEFSSDDINIVL